MVNMLRSLTIFTVSLLTANSFLLAMEAPPELLKEKVASVPNFINSDQITCSIEKDKAKLIHDNLLFFTKLFKPLPTKLMANQSCISAVAFTPDGAAVTGSANGTVLVWNLKENPPTHSVLDNESRKLKCVEWISAVAFSPDGRYALVGSDDNARLWDLKQKTFKLLKGHLKGVTSVAISPDGKYALTGSRDCTARYWDLSSKFPTHRILEGHIDFLTSVAISPNGKMALTGSEDGTARLWDLSSSTSKGFFLHNGKEQVYSVAFSPDGIHALVGSGDNNAYLYKLDEKSRTCRVLANHDRRISFAFSPEGRYVLACSDSKAAQLWDLFQSPPNYIDIESPNIEKVAFSPDGSCAITGSFAHDYAYIWDFFDKAKRLSLPQLQLLLTIKENPDLLDSNPSMRKLFKGLPKDLRSSVLKYFNIKIDDADEGVFLWSRPPVLELGEADGEISYSIQGLSEAVKNGCIDAILNLLSYKNIYRNTSIFRAGIDRASHAETRNIYQQPSEKDIVATELAHLMDDFDAKRVNLKDDAAGSISAGAATYNVNILSEYAQSGNVQALREELLKKPSSADLEKALICAISHLQLQSAQILIEAGAPHKTASALIAPKVLLESDDIHKPFYVAVWGLMIIPKIKALLEKAYETNDFSSLCDQSFSMRFLAHMNETDVYALAQLGYPMDVILNRSLTHANGTLLSESLSHGNDGITSALINAGAPVSEECLNIIKRRSLPFIRLLVQNLDISDYIAITDENPAYHLAVVINLKALELLLKKGLPLEEVKEWKIFDRCSRKEKIRYKVLNHKIRLLKLKYGDHLSSNISATDFFVDISEELRTFNRKSAELAAKRQYALEIAAIDGNYSIKALKECLLQKPPLKKMNTALAYAAARKNNPSIKLLLDAGADPREAIDVAEGILKRPITQNNAFERSQYENVLKILGSKNLTASILARQMPDIKTALKSNYGNLPEDIREKMSFLTDPTHKEKLDFFVQRHGNSFAALKAAIGKGPSYFIPQLLTQAYSDAGVYLLIPAVMHNRVDMVQILLNYGITAVCQAPDGKKLSPLMYAVTMTDDVTMTKAILEHPLMVHKRKILLTQENSRGHSPLALAFMSGRVEIVKLLIEYGASTENILDLTDDQGRNSLDCAIQTKSNYLCELVTSLARNKGRLPMTINNVSDRRILPLLRACRLGDPTVVNLLLENGALSNFPDSEGNTPLTIASKQGSKALVASLLNAGVDVNQKDPDGNTSLIIASSKGHTEIVMLLLDAKADIFLRNKQGQDALKVAENKNIALLINAKMEVAKGLTHGGFF